MPVIHETASHTQELAGTVDVASGFWRAAIGLMFRPGIPDDYAFVMQFDSPQQCVVHMLFVPFDIDVIWLTDNEVVKTKTLTAWTGFESATCDTVIELPAGNAVSVAPGDNVTVPL